jgi:hypothetical protein
MKAVKVLYKFNLGIVVGSIKSSGLFVCLFVTIAVCFQALTYSSELALL